MTVQMNTGDIGRRLGVPVTEELLKELGFKPIGKDKRAVLWEPSEYPAMAKAVGKWVAGRADVPMQPKPTKKTTPPPAAASGSAGDDDEEL